MTEPKVIYPKAQYLAKLYLNVVLIFAIFIFPWIFLGLIPELGWIYVLIFVVVNACWLVPTFLILPAYYKSIRYEIGEDEIVAHRGVLTKSVRTIPYRTITDFEVKRDLFDRWFFSMGSLDVQTAGHSAQAGPEMRLVGLEDWEGLRAELLQRTRRYRSGMALGADDEAPPTGGADEVLLRQILAEIKGLRQDLKGR